jgi:uncharacterized protein YndB with AHSA1/START domain
MTKYLTTSEEDVMTNEMGQILNSHSVRFERILPVPIETAWQYITSVDSLATWLCSPKTTMELSSGGRVNLRFDQADPANGATYNVRGIVEECTPPRVFAYSWFDTSFDLTSRVRFELEARGQETRLVMTHTHLPPDFMPKVGAGWHAHLDQLIAVMKGETPPEFFGEYNELFKRYSAVIAVTIIAGSAISPAIASSDNQEYKALNDQRQEYLRNYDRIWRDADRIKGEMDELKRDTHADVNRALDDLQRDLDGKYRDLKTIENDVRDLDKVEAVIK